MPLKIISEAIEDILILSKGIDTEAKHMQASYKRIIKIDTFLRKEKSIMRKADQLKLAREANRLNKVEEDFLQVEKWFESTGILLFKKVISPVFKAISSRIDARSLREIYLKWEKVYNYQSERVKVLVKDAVFEAGESAQFILKERYSYAISSLSTLANILYKLGDCFKQIELLCKDVSNVFAEWNK